jgi:hypothetical protein
MAERYSCRLERVYGRMVRKVLLVAAAGACLVLASPAHPQAGSTTVSGTLLNVQNELQIVSQSNGDGTVTKCGVVGGTLRTDIGDVNFGAGGVLTSSGTLEPGVQAIVDTLWEAERLGTAAVTTITFELSTICGYPGNVVTAASLTVTPTPTPAGPVGSAGPRPTPQPTMRTVTGIVTRMSAFGQLILGPTTCEMWPGILKPDAGPSLQFAVMTPLVGDLETSGLKPADPAAFKLAKLLQSARIFGTRAPVTMTVTGPVNACGYPLEAVVKTATIAFPSAYDTKPKDTRRGRITRLSRPSLVSGNGATCRIWGGSIKTTSGERKRFSIVTRLTGTPPRAADRRAVKTVATLRRAKRRGFLATITYAGSVIACGKALARVVTRASIGRG